MAFVDIYQQRQDNFMDWLIFYSEISKFQGNSVTEYGKTQTKFIASAVKRLCAKAVHNTTAYIEHTYTINIKSHIHIMS